jgi:hypothetical protein
MAQRDDDLKVDAAGRPYVELGESKFFIVDSDEAERASLVVCGPVSYFDDDVHASCADCGTAIVHRPYAPTTPPKVCLGCATSRLRGAP